MMSLTWPYLEIADKQKNMRQNWNFRQIFQIMEFQRVLSL